MNMMQAEFGQAALKVASGETVRGRTSAVVEGADWSKDGLGRWLAIGTRKHTVHVFPVNPYSHGGKTDIASHLEGRVRNVDAIVRFVFLIGFYIYLLLCFRIIH